MLFSGNKTGKAKTVTTVKTIPLAELFGTFNLVVPNPDNTGNKNNMELPQRVVDNFVAVAHSVLTKHLEDRKYADTGYSYIGAMENCKGGHKALVGLAQNKHAVKFSFMGEISTTPKTKSLFIMEVWGIRFFLEPAKDIEKGKFFPAWLVNEGSEWEEKIEPQKKSSQKKTVTDINMYIKSHELKFDFTYELDLEQTLTQKVVMTVYQLTANKHTLTKGVELKREAFEEEGVQVTGKPEESDINQITAKQQVTAIRDTHTHTHIVTTAVLRYRCHWRKQSPCVPACLCV